MDDTQYNPKRDYYSVLGISKNATTQQLKQARSKLALKYHPDTNRNKGSEEKFREVQDAYKILSNTDVRRRYDHESGVTRRRQQSINWSSSAKPDMDSTVAAFRKNYDQNVSSRNSGGGPAHNYYGHSRRSMSFAEAEIEAQAERVAARAAARAAAGAVKSAPSGAGGGAAAAGVFSGLFVLGGIMLVAKLASDHNKKHQTIDAFNNSIKQHNTGGTKGNRR